MFDIEIVEKKGEQLIDSKLLHKKLEVRSYHADWIRRRIDGYGFIEGEDYFISKMSKSKKMGRPTLDYLLSLDMAKELCMLENNDNGKATRKYFIHVEKEYRNKTIVRLAGKEVRKSLTDSIDKSGENERMHGRGYSNYTRMIYEITGLKEKFKFWKVKSKAFRDEYKGNFRDYITPEELELVKRAEEIIKPLLDMEKEYSEIKDILKPLFNVEKLGLNANATT